MSVSPDQQQQLVFQYQLLTTQLQQLQQYHAEMQAHIGVLQQVQESLRVLASQPEGAEILMPLATGLLVKGGLGKIDSVVLRVGAGVAVTKTPDEAQETLAAQIEELVGGVSDVAAEIASLQQQMHTLLASVA